MIGLIEFARTQGAKDKQKRKRRYITEGAIIAGAGGAAYEANRRIKVVNQRAKSGIDTVERSLAAVRKVRKQISTLPYLPNLDAAVKKYVDYSNALISHRKNIKANQLKNTKLLKTGRGGAIAIGVLAGANILRSKLSNRKQDSL